VAVGVQGGWQWRDLELTLLELEIYQVTKDLEVRFVRIVSCEVFFP